MQEKKKNREIKTVKWSEEWGKERGEGINKLSKIN